MALLIVSPQVCASPPATLVNSNGAAPDPTTRTGAVRFAVVPSPSWPLALKPQQYTPPSPVVPQVCRSPALTDVNTSGDAPDPTTCTGVLLLVIVPSPSSPRLLLPQQYDAP